MRDIGFSLSSLVPFVSSAWLLQRTRPAKDLRVRREERAMNVMHVDIRTDSAARQDE